LGKSASKTIKKDTQLRYEDVVSYEWKKENFYS
jgi:hypothetical protein